MVGGEPGVESDRHKSAFTEVEDVRNRRYWFWFKLTILDHAQSPGTLGNEDAVIRRESQRPGDLQFLRHDFHTEAKTAGGVVHGGGSTLGVCTRRNKKQY